MTAPAIPDPAGEAVEHVIDNIVHELRRADRQPIFQIIGGRVAIYHTTALAWGWLAPTSDESRLALTASGRSVLHQAGPPPTRLPKFPARP